MKREKYYWSKIICVSVVISFTKFGFTAEINTPPTPPGNLKISSELTPTTPIPPTPVGKDGLLSGMTPENYKVPSGWSLVTTQDFEGNAIPINQSIYGSITNTRPHRGSKSLEGTYERDQSNLSWILRSGYIENFNEVYLSFFEYTESQARFNDEYWVAQFEKRGPAGDLYQEVILDWMWVPNFNDTSAYLYVVPQSASGGGTVGRYGGALQKVPTGYWVQWELHYRPNTPGNPDGFLRVYKDGILWEENSAENKNLNGNVNMENMSVQAGGIYTKLAWMKDWPACNAPSQCSSSFGGGTDLCMSEKGWWGQSFTDPFCPNTAQSNFNRFIDDVIVIKK